MTLYNEIEPYACSWLGNLVKAGHIADGKVDGRSIKDLEQHDLAGHNQAHFFAGIGVWSAALRAAGIPDTANVWTGSCPCQPFSVAGKGLGLQDPRHLWPDWFRLIRQCAPTIVFGEQVASKDGLAWLDAVSIDLESEDYSFAAADLCAAGFGAPHLRQRLYFVAYSNKDGCHGINSLLRGWRSYQGEFETTRGSTASSVGNTDKVTLGGQPAGPLGSQGSSGDQPNDNGSGNAGSCMVYPDHSQRWGLRPKQCADESPTRETGPVNGWWANAEWIECNDGKARPIEPGTFPLADRAPNHVGRLRAYGNAIVMPQAAAFVVSSFEAIEDTLAHM